MVEEARDPSVVEVDLEADGEWVVVGPEQVGVECQVKECS